MTTTGAKTRHKKVNLPRCFKIHRSCSVKIRQFPFVLQSCSDGKEMYKTALYTCKVVVLPIERIAFLPFLLPSPSLLLNLPSESVECSGEYVVMSFASPTTSRAWPFACLAFCSTDYRKKRDCSQSTSPYAHTPQELGHRELSTVVNLHERKFLNRYSYFKEMIVVVKRFCQVINI